MAENMRKMCLTLAQTMVNGDREEDYGSVENNFNTIATFWNAYIKSLTGADISLHAHDVAAMMSLLKIARISSGHAKGDNWVDLAGYSACGMECQHNELDYEQKS